MLFIEFSSSCFRCDLSAVIYYEDVVNISCVVNSVSLFCGVFACSKYKDCVLFQK
jgi:hypothetical protein